MHETFSQNNTIVEGLPPAADAAGRSARWVNLKNTARCYVKLHVAQGNAAPVALTIMQAQNVAGLNAKAITLAQRIWANLAADVSDTFVQQADAVSFTTDAALHSKHVLFEIDPTLLDVNNGFCCIQAITGASNAVNITEIEYLMTEPRYKQQTPPTYLT